MIELYSSEIELHFFGAIFMKIRIVEFVDMFLLKISLADIFQRILKLIFLNFLGVIGLLAKMQNWKKLGLKANT